MCTFKATDSETSHQKWMSGYRKYFPLLRNNFCLQKGMNKPTSVHRGCPPLHTSFEMKGTLASTLKQKNYSLMKGFHCSPLLNVHWFMSLLTPAGLPHCPPSGTKHSSVSTVWARREAASNSCSNPCSCCWEEWCCRESSDVNGKELQNLAHISRAGQPSNYASAHKYYESLASKINEGPFTKHFFPR